MAALDVVSPAVSAGRELALGTSPPPTEEEALAGRLTARLLLATEASEPPPPPEPAVVAAAAVWSGAARLRGHQPRALQPRVRRTLRRAAATCPALAPLADQTVPHKSDPAVRGHPRVTGPHDRGGAGRRGITVRWPPQLRTALVSRIVIGTPHGTRPGAAA
ncbi:hypothetical protein PS467_41195 [Streptomyces luomodiensis]|uniref:Uncharacterized protein n=1 Tax=Streptomyces luomodiensis TaxID=3026192 RepID=A0ABY9V8R1_9ACTN|nr:hypothetical protein [Streptomyces sp. SCA4-21]WNF01300.1 hypothetical protein PS467_41195 [Streptomyces sp. SCA4-21]